MKTKLKLIGLACLAALFTACSTPNVNRIVSVTGTATRAAIAENPLTGLYELQVGRAQANGTVVPVVWQTNSSGTISAVVPNVVQRYEVIGKNGIFGNVGVTWTVATGDDAVKTILGGMSLPVNSGQATNQSISVQGFNSPPGK